MAIYEMEKEKSLFKKLKDQGIPSLLKHPENFIKEKLGIINYERIVVETSNLCNCRCVWCWMYFSKKKDMGIMSFENFKSFIDLNVDFLKKAFSIVPYHRGEPLINQHFFDMLDYAKQNNVNIGGIHTNLSLNINIERLANAPLSYILVNIGGTTQDINQKVMKGSDLELVKKNLKELIDKNKNKFPISIKMNPTKENLHQIDQLPIFFKELGGNPKNAIIGTTGFSLPNEASKEEVDTFFNNIIREDMNQHLRFTYDNNQNITAKVKKCSFMVPTVKWDGKVSVCCHDQLSKLNLGNAFKTPMIEILKSRKYKDAEAMGKKKSFSFCKECN
jgi:sulfatase maturation enzyme AslB (radical SAM superfamily)